MSWSSLRRGQLAAFAAAVHLLRGPEAETTVARHDWPALAAITLLDGDVGSQPSPLPPMRHRLGNWSDLNRTCFP